jgi:hypothetical protein
VSEDKKNKLLGTPAVPTTSYSARSVTFITPTGLSKLPVRRSIFDQPELHPYELGRILFW